MSRTGAFVLAFFAGLSSATVATAAEPVETVINDWIAAIDAAPDWAARFDSLSYDKATDTAIVAGLTIAYAPIGLTLSFRPITIVGYAEAADGRFGAEMVATDGATASGDGFEASLADIRYEGLGNLARDFSELTAWDPQRPFTSLIQAYARFLDIRLARAEIGSMSMTTEGRGEQVVFAYEDIALEDWANGKVARIATGPLTIAASGVAEPFSMTVGGTEARDIDYAALLRLYDPDQYVGGVGDGIWRNAVESVEYDTIVFDTREAKLTFGKLSLADFRVRQPEKTFNVLFDQVLLDQDSQKEPTTEDLRALFGYLSSFAVGIVSVQDIDVEGQDGGAGHLGEMRIADASIDQVGEVSLDHIEVATPDQGKVDIDRIAVGGIVFRSLAALVEAMEAEEAGEDFDYSRLATQLAFFEANAVDIDMPDSPRVKLDKARLDLGNYVGPIPTLMALDVAGADLPATAIEDPGARAMWQAFGYDRIHADLSARLAWNENDESVRVDDFRAAIDGVGALSLDAMLGGLSRAALDNLEGLPAALAGLNFVRGTLSLENYDILDRWIDRQAALSGRDPAALRRQIAAMLAEMSAGIGEVGFRERLRQVIEASVMVPGSITATAVPAAPVPLAALAILAQSAPASLPDLLGLTIETTSAGTP